MQKLMSTGNGPCHALTSTHLKARLILQGASGSGKTYSALLLAYGLCENLKQVAVVESCHKATAHYSSFGDFRVIPIEAPYHSEKFLDALQCCESSGIEVIIIDTLSAEWIASGGILQRREEQDCLHYHEALLHAIRHCKAHVIAILQTTEHYELLTTKGKVEVEKIGVTPLQQDGIHYHFDTVLALDSKHKVKCLKDRTSFFEDHNGTLITEETAGLFPQWLNTDVPRIHFPAGMLKSINSNH